MSEVFFDPEARWGDGELAVIGQHQQPFGLTVETPDGEHPWIVGTIATTVGADLWVISGGDHPAGLFNRK